MPSISAEMIRRGWAVGSAPMSSSLAGEKDVFVGGRQSVAQYSRARLMKETFSGQSDSGRGGGLTSPNQSAVASASSKTKGHRARESATSNVISPATLVTTYLR